MKIEMGPTVSGGGGNRKHVIQIRKWKRDYMVEGHEKQGDGEKRGRRPPEGRVCLKIP